jgi:UDP-3-O-[3-hydroxymyristoyl] N-acetylglucosamine deacetylase
MGLALGGSLDNAVVIDDTRILNPEGLRFEDEFVRHKILDAIGDLSLLGTKMIGDYEAFAGSHDLNHKLTLEILSNAENYELVTLGEKEAAELEEAFA